MYMRPSATSIGGLKLLCIPEAPVGIAKKGTGGQGAVVTDSLYKNKKEYMRP
jgi:hypothetical protein